MNNWKKYLLCLLLLLLCSCSAAPPKVPDAPPDISPGTPSGRQPVHQGDDDMERLD